MDKLSNCIFINRSGQVWDGEDWLEEADVNWETYDITKPVSFPKGHACTMLVSVKDAQDFLIERREKLAAIDLGMQLPEEEPSKDTRKKHPYVSFMGLPILSLPEECHYDGIHHLEFIRVRGVDYYGAYIEIENGVLTKVGLQPHLMFPA